MTHNVKCEIEDCSCRTVVGDSSQMIILEHKSSPDIIYKCLVSDDCDYATEVEVPTVNMNVDKLLKNTANWFKRAN